ncbi:MAG: hypothetical protein E6I39_07670 [Chloroflexi bacterium]|nr:MAG: hypothetical protein E6I39_07670 [Chloroflexota bacterium]
MAWTPAPSAPRSWRTRGLSGWLWRRRIAIAANIAAIFALSTAYVAWALKDLPDPNGGLAAGDIIILDDSGPDG